jgi:hypothetical protein
VDDPESPDFSPDGRKIAFSALRNGVGDIFVVDVESGQVENLTNDAFADHGPTFSPDGRTIVYVARISGNEKLFKIDLGSGTKTQLTFGTHDDSSVQFLDAETLVFSSTATDPGQPIEPDVARNGNIYNIWTLNLKTGELKQFTDALGGNYSAVVLNEGNNKRIAFVSYYKNEYALHTLERKEPIVTAASSDFGSPGPVIDFQPPLVHTLVTENKRRKGTFEKLFLDGRPPVAVGVTSGGDVFGGSMVTFSDVLGDKQFSLFAASVSQYRTLSFQYLNLARRFQYALQGFSSTQFFYGQLEGIFYDPAFSGIIDRDFAVATRTVRGGTAYGIWPLDRYRRFEVSGGVLNYLEEFQDPLIAFESAQYQQAQFGQQLFRNGTMVPLGVSFVQETTVFREFGPLAGNTMRLAYDFAPKIGNTLSRQTADIDMRYYLRLGGSGLLAMRARGFKSWGDYPDFLYFGGNSEMRGYEYLEFVGQNAFFLNAELRFPFIEAMLTPIGILGGVRGVFFANLGGAWWEDYPFKVYARDPELVQPVVDYDPRTLQPVLGPRRVIDGFRLVDSRASYGVGLETFALGFPIHFDWSWKTLFNKDYEDYLFAIPCDFEDQRYCGGSSQFRRVKFAVWIGYDF